MKAARAPPSSEEGTWAIPSYQNVLAIKEIPAGLLLDSSVRSDPFGVSPLGRHIPQTPMQYRVKYSLYRIEAASASEAKKKVLDIMKKQGDLFISVEDASIYNEKRGFLKRLFLG